MGTAKYFGIMMITNKVF